MKVHGWHIDGFGVHHDVHVDDLPDGLTIVTGPNEAGKTTLQHFLIGMLFGFSAKHRPDHHAPLNGGNYGGRLFVTDTHGHDRTIHRSAQRSSLRITSSSGEVAQGELTAMLGGASKDLYQSIFAVHLAELAELRALTEDEVRDRVFSAGVLGAGRTAQQALAELSAERDQLYKPGGRDRKDPYRLKALHAQLSDARLALRDAQRQALGLPELMHRVETLTDQASGLAGQADALRARHAVLRAVAELWPTWVEGRDAARELASLGELPLHNEQAAARLSATVELHRDRERTLAIATTEHAAAAGLAASLPQAGPALSHIDEITALRSEVTAERTRRDHLAELTTQMQSLSTELHSELAVLGTQDPAWLNGRMPRAEAAAELRTAATAVTTAGHQAAQAADGLSRLTEDLAAEASEIEAAEAALSPVTGPSSASALAGLEAATTLVALTTQRDACAERLGSLTTESSATGSASTTSALPTWAAVAAIIGLASFALVARFTELSNSGAMGAVTLAAAAVLAAAGIGVLIARRPQSPTGTAPAGAAAYLTAELDRLNGEIAGVAATLGLSGPPSAAKAVAIRAAAERLATEAQRQAHERTSVANRRSAFQHGSDRRLGLAQQRLADATTVLSQAEAGWTSWLQANDLPTTLDPAGADQFLAALARAHRASASLQDVTASRARTQHASHLLHERVDVVATALSHPSAPDPLTTIAELAALADAALEAQHQRTAAEAALLRATDALAQAQLGLIEAAAELETTLTQLGATNIDHALELVAQHQRAHELRTTIRRAESSFDAAIGTQPERVQHARDLLAAADPTAWAVQTRELEAEIATLITTRDQIVQDQARAQAELQQLASSSDVPTRELQVTNLEAQLVDAVTHWASLTLAHKMIEGTLARYQRERQPDVVKRAASLFQLVTDGRYVRLEIRDNEVIAISRTEQEVPAASLSQGTVEQLYLCMRFALAESFAKTAALPLLLDDPAVNADPKRLPHLADMIASVASHQQVFVFTCQDAMVDLLQQASPDARVINLPSSLGSTGTVGLAAG